MTCRELVSAIDPYLDDELTVMETLRMQGHLLFCEACRQAIESEALLRSFVLADAAADEAPAALRERIRRRVALIPSMLPGRRSRPRRPVLSRALLAGLAMLGLVLGALVVLGVRDRDHISSLAAEVAAKHLLYGIPAESTLELATSETVRMAAWLERRLGFSVKLPLLARPGERLVGGRVSSIADTPAAYLLYERNGRRISLLITQPAPSMHRGRASRVVEGVEFYTASLHGVALVWWEDTQRLYAAASTAGQKDLLEFALLCVRSGGQSRAMDRVS